MWEYSYRKVLIGKHREEVHKIIGNPNESTIDKNWSLYEKNKNL